MSGASSRKSFADGGSALIRSSMAVGFTASTRAVGSTATTLAVGVALALAASVRLRKSAYVPMVAVATTQLMTMADPLRRATDSSIGLSVPASASWFVGVISAMRAVCVMLASDAVLRLTLFIS